MSYRDVVYTRYASVVKRYPSSVDQRAARSWGAAFRRYLSGWLPRSREARIGDLGCGSGRLLHLLKDLGYSNVIGVDISAEQVALAQQVHRNVVHGDVLEFLVDKDETFDLLLGLDLVEHFDKDEAGRFLTAARAALKSGGRLVLNTPNAASPMFGTRRYGDFTHEVGFTPGCLATVLELYGLSDVEARELGPYLHGPVSAVRVGLWEVIRWGLMLYNYVEIGHKGDGIYTRDFLISGTKPSEGSAQGS